VGGGWRVGGVKGRWEWLVGADAEQMNVNLFAQSAEQMTG
jgi:hypothetical protein